jgi:hypothetical protein
MNHLKVTLDERCLLESAIESDPREAFRPYFHGLGLPWEEDKT